MADKRISQLVDRGTVANNDVVPIVVSGATTTNKATISSIQTFMQGNLDLGVTSVGITLGSSGTDVSVSGSPITSSGNITINLPTASATNRGLLSAADWVTFNSKQDAGSFVTLNTTQTITAQKTFTTSGSSDTMIISHGSGSGFALDVLKAGNGEAIRVTKTSGSGNAMTISGGNFEAGTIVKTGGTSSQFLKADGSVDSNSYLTTGSAGSTYVPYSGATGNVDLGTRVLSANNLVANGGFNAGALLLKNADAASLIDTGYFKFSPSSSNTQISFGFSTGASTWKQFSFSSHLITNNTITIFSLPNGGGTLALTSDIPSLAGYVTLATTQTITGAKTFDTTTSDFLILNSTNANGGTLTFRRSGTNVGHIGNSGVLGVGILDDLEVRSGIGKGLHLKTDGGKLTLSSGGSVTLDGALNGTSASFTSNIVSTSGFLQFANNYGIEGRNVANSAYRTLLKFNSSNQIEIGRDTDISAIILGTASANNALSIATTGAATFSSSVTGSGIISKGTTINNNNNHRFLRADNTEMGYIGWSNENANNSTWLFKSSNGNPIAFSADATNQQLVVTTAGNVGIGTASPGQALDVYRDTSTASYVVARNGSGVQVAMGVAGDNGSLLGTLSNHNLRIVTNGAVVATITSGGITRALRFQVGAGGILAGNYCEFGNDDNVGYVDTQRAVNNGDFHFRFDGTSRASINRLTGAYTPTSDVNAKKDFEESTFGLNEILQLKPTLYRMKDDESEGEKELGFIAQEVKDFIPNAYVESGEFIGLNFNPIVAALVKAIQELKTEIDSLKNQMQ